MNKVEFFATIVLIYYGLLVIPLMIWVLWQNYCQTTQQIVGVVASRLEAKKSELAKISYFKSILSADLVQGTTVGGEAYYNISYLQRGQRKDAMITWAAVVGIVLSIWSCMLVIG